jgi:hypothetical protein
MALLLGGLMPADRDADTAVHDSEHCMTIGPVTLLESGALRPQHSLLAALGVTRRAIVSTPESSCRSCDLAHCRYRRARYARDSSRGVIE